MARPFTSIGGNVLLTAMLAGCVFPKMTAIADEARSSATGAGGQASVLSASSAGATFDSLDNSVEAGSGALGSGGAVGVSGSLSENFAASFAGSFGDLDRPSMAGTASDRRYGFGGSTANGSATEIPGGGQLSVAGQGGLSAPASGIGAAGTVQMIARSCEKLASTCQNESCCQSTRLSGGAFQMGRGTAGAANDSFQEGYPNEVPAHDAIVADFSLDKYEVTVGRFRQFLEDYDVWHGTIGAPALNDGANPNVPNSGWGQGWSDAALTTALPSTADQFRARLACSTARPTTNTWTASPSANETFPINCVTWYEAFAFCIWDGGRLPTEAEWEYAACGGMQDRRYPWGSQPPELARANYADSSASPFVPVGNTAVLGAGLWGQADLAGSVKEWVLDSYLADYASGPAVWSNYANTDATEGAKRVARGGAWDDYPNYLRAAARVDLMPDERFTNLGFRCAR